MRVRRVSAAAICLLAADGTAHGGADATALALANGILLGAGGTLDCVRRRHRSTT